jgi:hypothetical protein
MNKLRLLCAWDEALGIGVIAGLPSCFPIDITATILVPRQ